MTFQKTQTWHPQRMVPENVPALCKYQNPWVPSPFCVKWQCCHSGIHRFRTLAFNHCGHTGLTVRFLSVNFSCSFLTCLGRSLCRSWEQRCLRRPTVTSRGARQQGASEAEVWAALETVVPRASDCLRLTNYSHLRSSC